MDDSDEIEIQLLVIPVGGDINELSMQEIENIIAELMGEIEYRIVEVQIVEINY